ncbi:hypothetical protein J4447_03560 [Candidatus Pacearchaeota archaeon]|nr:hypothetical protein [Candidatus Aenigmarchaeota archaeon]MBS3074504.1 hypothetical protein [Candidatus Pacearchaeota archaeon]
MATDLEKAQLMSVLARSKGNWGEKYDRTEHFKRFQNLKDIVKDLAKIRWILIYKKPQFTGLSLNTQFKSEIINFIENQMPHLRGILK